MSVSSLHLFSGAKSSPLKILQAFGLLRLQLRRLPSGVLFAKALGCGQGAAFSMWPDWSRYAVMMECATPEDELRLLASKGFNGISAVAVSHRRIELAAFRKRGAWEGQSPFEIQADEAGQGRVAVLTRAAISLRRIPHFIHQSRAATHALEGARGLEFSLGMGELPLILQATFSIWESDEAMKAYAYKDARHIAAMKAKKEKAIFGEEMFVRFRVVIDELMA